MSELRAPRLLTTNGGLVMRPLSAIERAPLHELWTSAGVRRYLWDGEVIPAHRTAEIIARNEQMFGEQSFGLWGVRRNAYDDLIGFGGLWYFRDPPELELLYGVAEREWGRGIATDAARAVLDYAFNTLGMPSIRASTDADNVASVRVLDKLGFTPTRRATTAGLDTLFFELQRAAS